ncbi:MAG TPA: hypothetical protein VNG91_06460, partial [Terriglobia bacterium]|nr:hypothetical protein [Terriglobia bacterium]
LEDQLASLKDGVYNPGIQHEVEEDFLHELEDFHQKLSELASDLASTYPGETSLSLYAPEMSEMRSELDQHLKDFNELLKTQVVGYNKVAYAGGAPTLLEGSPITVQAPGSL